MVPSTFLQKNEWSKSDKEWEMFDKSASFSRQLQRGETAHFSE